MSIEQQPPAIESLRFLTPDEAREIRAQFGSPCYVYDERTLVEQVAAMQAMPSAFGLRVRYSIKALPSLAILRLLDSHGCMFDASSEWEARRAILAGVAPAKVTLTAQEVLPSAVEVLEQGVEMVAGSLLQLEAHGRRFPGTEVSLRINPGAGSGAIKRLTSGGRYSSFGLWHTQLPMASALLAKYSLRLRRIHHHIGSGHDSGKWAEIAKLTLDMAAQMGNVPIINLGGGYRVAAFRADPTPDPTEAFTIVRGLFEEHAARTGSRPILEIEPGTRLVANAGSIVTTVTDVVETDASLGYAFLKIDSGMTEVARPALYGALHPLVNVPVRKRSDEARTAPVATKLYVVVGHCCIAGDVLTPALFDTESLLPHRLEEARPGDCLVIERAGGYCSSMSVKNFNSFPEAPEVLRRRNGEFLLIRRRQTLQQMVQNEVVPEDLCV